MHRLENKKGKRIDSTHVLNSKVFINLLGATSSDEDSSTEVGKEAIPSNNFYQEMTYSTQSEDLEQTTRDSTPSKTLTNKTLQQEFELLSLNLGSVKAEGLTSGKRSIKFTATVAANQVK